MRFGLLSNIIFGTLLTLFGSLQHTILAADSGQLSAEIDRQIDARLTAEGLQRVPQAEDAEFLRRVTLDLHGIVPTAEQATKFLASTDPAKRAKLIDELLAHPRYGQHFGNQWRARLVSTIASENRQQTERFTEWVAQRFNDNAGWDRIVFDLLTATGKLEDNPSVFYLIEGRNPLGVADLTDLTSHYFLGIRLNCAQCHDHPFAPWKREDYWGMAAFFTQIQTPGRAKQVYMAGVQDNPKLTLGTLAGADMLEGYLDRRPQFLGSQAIEETKEPTRKVLAKWMTAGENPFFARAAVNRLWWHFYGRGLVNPVDDMHSGNSPTHPELLQLLSEQFVASGFDLKFLCGAILNSRTYQQTSRPGNQADAEGKWFARMSVKVHSAEQTYDSLVEILGPPAKASGIDARLGTRYEFTLFFASDGDPDPLRYDRGIPHALRMMNSPQFAGRNIAALVSRITAEAQATEKVIDELFLTVLSRRATTTELELVQERIPKDRESREPALRELAWSLLMSSEFSLNH